MTRRELLPNNTLASLTAFRERIGKPIERWRNGIYALLVTRPKAGKVVKLKPKPPAVR